MRKKLADPAAGARIARLLTDLRRGGVADDRVLAALERIPRAQFVSSPFADQAYENAALPIGCGQTISKIGYCGYLRRVHCF